MKLSVISVTLNAESVITAALDSVLALKDHVHEYLVIDGLSSDGTVGTIKAYEPRFEGKLRWISEADAGLYDAMNKGINMASGDFVLFLGADDRLLPGVTAAVDADLSEGADLVYGDVASFDTRGGQWHVSGGGAPKQISGIPKSMPTCHQGQIVSVRALRALGGFDTSYRIAADYEFYLRFREADYSGLYVPVSIARYCLGGISSRLVVQTAREYRRAHVAHGVSPLRAAVRMWRSVLNVRLVSALHAGQSVLRGLRRRS